MKRFIVNIADNGSNFDATEYATLEAAQAAYNEILSRLEGTEKYHSEDNTDEWVYIEMLQCTLDDDNELVDTETIAQSECFYRDALL